MKCAAVFLLVSFALLSQAFAVLRPLFPLKPAPPLGDELIGTGDDFLRGGLILHENDWPYIFTPDQQSRRQSDRHQFVLILGRAIDFNRPRFW
jgi:hypothetical protein